MIYPIEAMTYHISDVLPRVMQDLAKRPNLHYMVMKASDRLATPKRPAVRAKTQLQASKTKLA